MKIRLHNKSGIALTVVIIVLAILAMMAGYILNLGYNRRRVVDAASGTRAKIYYRAQAGVYDATFRIRRDYTGAQQPAVPIAGPEALTPALTPVGTFTNPAYNPDPYNIDTDANGVMDTSVDIGPVNGAGQRPIISTGLADV